MSSKNNQPDPSAPRATKTDSAQTGQSLWEQAEETMHNHEVVSLEDLTAMSPDETLRMLHALQAQQVALKTQNEALRKSEVLFQKLFASHSAVKLIIDAETGYIIDANQAAAAFYGWPIEQLKQMRIQQINTLPPEAVQAAMQQAALSEHARFEFHHRRADGSIREVEVFSNKIDIPGNNIFFSIIYDITERKRSEAALRRSEACFQVANKELEAQNKELTWLWEKSRLMEHELSRFNEELLAQSEQLAATNMQVENEKKLLAAVMEALPIGVAITDTMGGSLQSNSEFERIWGAPRPIPQSVKDYTAYKAWWDDTDKPVAPEEWASARAVQKGESTVGQVLRIQRFDGSEAFVINSASPVYDAQGVIIGSAVAIQDITELKRIELALLENKKDFARAQEVGNIGSWRLDIQRNVLTWSDENYRIFEVPAGTPLQYESFLAIVHPDDRAYVDTQWKAALCGQPYDIEHRIVVHGRTKWVREKAYLELDKNGLLVGGFGITQDFTKHKLIEEALRKSEARHRVLANTMLQGVIHRDANGTIIEMNSAAETILGKTCEQFMSSNSVQEELDTIRENGEPFPGIEHPSMVALRTGLPVRDVNMGVFNPKRGEYRWICIDAVPVFAPNETFPSEVYAVFEDITERKEKEEAIRRNNAILEGINSVFTSALTCPSEEDLAVACLDVAQELTQSEFGFIGDINEKGLHDIAISNPGWEACTIVDAKGHRRPPCNFKIHGIYGQVIADGKAFFTNDPANYPGRIGLPPGHPPVNAFLGAPLVREGHTIGMIALANRPKGYTLLEQQILTALTPAIAEAFARKRTEESLRQSEEQFRMLFTNLTEGFCIIDVLFDTDEHPIDFRILTINPALERLIGHRDVRGKLRSEFVPGTEPHWLELLGKVAQSGEPVRHADEVKALNRWFDVSAYKVGKQNNHMVAVLVNDITDRKQTEKQLVALNNDLEKRVERRTQELQETQKQYLHVEKLSAIGKLSASIAHEFNNPLQGILAVLKGLRKRAILEKEDKLLLDEAIEESNRIKDLIRSLQEFNRPSSGRKSLVDVHHSLDAVLLLHKSDFKGKMISVVLNYAERLPQIHAVPDQIKQVFLNLLINAADACQHSGGVITISTWQEDANKVAVAIKDTGIGIPPSDIDLIFQPFFTTKTEIKGTGLGLSISHGIVKHHQGEIRVTSCPGEGTTFTVLLPVFEAHAIS